MKHKELACVLENKWESVGLMVKGKIHDFFMAYSEID